MNSTPLILIVDDEPFNVDYLEQELEDFGYATISAENGQEALKQVETDAPDMILLDIMMPIMDGFEVLEVLRKHDRWRDIPVVVISATNDIDNIVRGIELGADDYLPKPFNPTLLEARLKAGLEKKRQRDREVEYLAQVDQLTSAAIAVQSDSFDESDLQTVAQRSDALGTLAQVFQKMAHEVHAREQRLRLQIKQLQLDIQEQEHGATESAAVYIPIDRRHALAKGVELPERSKGSALFADISGFTPLTAALVTELGKQRGAEEIARQLKQIYTVLIAEVHAYGGSVIGFSGDAITCWFAGDSGLQTVACGLAIQKGMGQFNQIKTATGKAMSIQLKVAITAGTVRRFVVGRSDIQKVDVIAGNPIDQLAILEKLAKPGEILVESSLITDQLGVIIVEWRGENRSAAVISGLNQPVLPTPWPDLPAPPNKGLKQWLLTPAYAAILDGTSQFTPELRPAYALFLQFFGINFDQDPQAGDKLDQFLSWAQRVVQHYGGHVIQVTTGDKGSFLYASFGALIAHADDAVRAVMAAMDLSKPAETPFINRIQIGVTGGEFYAGAYGSPTRRTYGALGDKANMAARLMVAAEDQILCDEFVYKRAKESIGFNSLHPIRVKGKSGPLAVFTPTAVKSGIAHHSTIDKLPSTAQMTLKIASVIGTSFSLDELFAIYPQPFEKEAVSNNLDLLQENALIVLTDSTFAFATALIHQVTYDLMLFSQKRQLHRALATWLEENKSADTMQDYTNIAHHWLMAEDQAKAVALLEKAGEQARVNGDFKQATQLYNQALELEAKLAR